MNKMYEEYVRNCKTCQRNKHKNRYPNTPLGNIEPGKKPWDKIFYDLIGPYPPSGPENFKYVLTAEDSLTGFVATSNITSKDTDAVAKALVEDVFLMYGFPLSVTHDQAKEFNSDVMNKVHKLIKVKTKNCTIYNAKSNGVEQVHGSLKTYMRCYLSHDKTKDNWSAYTKLATYLFNSTKSSRSLYSPWELLFGRTPNEPISKVDSSRPVYTYDSYYDNLRHRIKMFNEIALERRNKSEEKDKKKWDESAQKKVFTQGEKILVKKFVRGPFDALFDEAEVVEDLNEQNAKIIRGGKTITIHKDKLLKLPNTTV